MHDWMLLDWLGSPRGRWNHTQGYLPATKSIFAQRFIPEDEARVGGILCEISRSRVPGLRHVRCREQRVEVRISSSPTKVICWCDIYMFVSHLMATNITAGIARSLQDSTICYISYQVAKILYQYYIYTAGPLHFFRHIPETYNNNTILVSLYKFHTVPPPRGFPLQPSPSLGEFRDGLIHQ